MNKDKKVVRLSEIDAGFGKQSAVKAWRKRNPVCRPHERVEFDSHNINADWFRVITKEDDHD